MESDKNQSVERASDLWDLESPRSVLHLVAPELSQKIQEARQKLPEFFDIPETELRKKLKEREKKISIVENQVRLRFWYEYEQAQANDYNFISMRRVLGGVCSINMFRTLANRPETLAWIMCPPIDYMSHIDEMLSFGAVKMREIMEMDAINPETGTINTNLLKIQKDLYLAAELRKFGGIPQVTKNLNLTLGGQHAQESIEAKGDEILERKLEELKSRQKKIITVKPTPLDSIDV